MYRFVLLSSCALASVGTVFAQAQTPDFSHAVHDIVVSSNIPTLNLTVRNVSASTDPADRNLRVVSDMPEVLVNGQVWCKNFQTSDNNAVRARLMLGATNVVSSQNGADPYPLGIWQMSDQQTFSGTHNLENFELDMTVDFPTSWNGQESLIGFNPVEFVEYRLESFIANNAGSEADFLRTDDVFETTIRFNVVGWCHYENDSIDGEYAGMRSYDMKVSIFYQGDDDIQDVITAVNHANTVTSQTPDRARDVTRTRAAERQTPTRNTTRSRPRRAPNR